MQRASLAVAIDEKQRARAGGVVADEAISLHAILHPCAQLRVHATDLRGHRRGADPPVRAH